MLEKLSGWKTFVFFFITGLLGLVTAFEGIDWQGILLPLACQVDPDTIVVVDGATGEDYGSCVEGVIKITGYVVTALSAVGVWLRTITKTSIFQSLKTEGGE